jgi:uncharacterized protein (DUF305 family)
MVAGLAFTLMLVGCGQANPRNSGGPMPGMGETATAAAMGGMDHGAMASATSAAPYDAQFIDSMIEHHTGAITMAKQALQESQRPEIKQLAEGIIASQQREVDQMKGWRQQWFPGLAPTGGMGMNMGDMQVGGDTSKPFDQRFITAMIAHHNGAIAMAKDAQTKAEHAEIKQLAAAIIKAQESEVAQLQQWNRQWFGA